MTPAENLCQELDGTARGKCPGCNEYEVPPQMEQAAAMIRRLADALKDAHSIMLFNQRFKLKQRHADALRDVRDIPVEEA